jgi:hypothetical protein
MINTKLVRALSTLSKEEWISFKKYLLMNVGETSEVYILFTAIYNKRGSLKNIESQEFYISEFFPHLSNKSFSNILSKINDYLQTWMAIEEMNSSKYDAEIYLLKSLNKRGLYQEANLIFKKLESKITKDEKLDFDKKTALSKLYHFQYYSDNPKSQEDRNIFERLIQYHMESYKEMTHFYLIELINAEVVLKEDHTSVIKILKSSISEISATELSKRLDLIENSIRSLEYHELKNLSKDLLNDSYTKDSATEEYVSLYLLMLAKKYWTKGMAPNTDLLMKLQSFQLENETKKSKISVKRFHNIINTICHILSYQKTKEFIDQWIDSVDSKLLNETKDLAYAQNCFHHKKYNELILYVRFISFDNLGQKLRAMAIHTISHFLDTSKDREYAINSIKSFKLFLKRNKNEITPFIFESNFNLCHFLEILVKDKIRYNEINLNQYTPIAFRSWVEEITKKGG